MIDWDGTATEVADALRARGIETDLSNADLVAYAEAARAEIAARIGETTGIVRRFDGGQRYLFVSPAIGTVTSLTEDGTPLTDGTTYRIGPGGAYVERIEDGYPRRFGSWIELTYNAAAQDDRYDRVVVDLVKLAIAFSGYDSRRDGDYAEEAAGARGGGLNGYQQQRDLLISELVGSEALFA